MEIERRTGEHWVCVPEFETGRLTLPLKNSHMGEKNQYFSNLFDSLHDVVMSSIWTL